jgi:hypothetical protein
MAEFWVTLRNPVIYACSCAEDHLSFDKVPVVEKLLQDTLGR